MSSLTTYAISLHDHVVTLFEWIGDLKTKKSWRDKDDTNKRYSPSFNHTIFFQALLDEVFEKITDPRLRNYTVPIGILTDEGLDHYNAEFICSRMYQNLLGQISTTLPDLTFSKLGTYSYSMVNDFDLLIMVPND